MLLRDRLLQRVFLNRDVARMRREVPVGVFGLFACGRRVCKRLLRTGLGIPARQFELLLAWLIPSRATAARERDVQTGREVGIESV